MASTKKETQTSVRKIFKRNLMKIAMAGSIFSITVFFNLIYLGILSSSQAALSQERSVLEDYESEHYTWIVALSNSINKGTAFTGEIEASDCSFSQYLNAMEDRSDTGLIGFSSQADKLHQELHQIGAEAIDLSASEEGLVQAGILLENDLIKKMAELVDLIDSSNAVRTEVIDSLITRQNILTMITFVLGGAVTILLVRLIQNIFKFIEREVIHPIEELNEKCQLLKQGQLDIDFELDVTNELGELASSLHTAIDMIKTYIKAIDLAMEDFSQGNFSNESPVVFEGDFHSIYDSIAKFVIKITGTLYNMTEAISQISAGAEELSAGSQDLAQGATEQSGSIQLLSQAIAKIKEQIHHNAAYTKEADTLGIQAKESILNSQEHMRQLVAVMEELTEMSEGIKNIIGTIESIASETNLLALNASIESARAGVAGKGFAVVANEIGKLAQESSDAVKNTTDLIEKSLSCIEKGKSLTESARNAFDEVATSSRTIVGMINKIAIESDKQTTEASHIASGIDEITTVVQTNAAISEQSAAASQELSAQTEVMTSLIHQFKLRKIK